VTHMKNDAQLKADEPPVELNFQGKTAFLTLNRPRVGNALSAALVEAIGEALDAAFAANARLIVFRGAGRHLCTGFDLAGLERNRMETSCFASSESSSCFSGSATAQ